MDYEKAYKDALERARKLYDSSEYVCEMDNYATIFPELRESEDEKIKKNIRIALMSMEDNLTTFYSTHHTSQKELLAWLEKQGEQKQDPCKVCDNPMLNCNNFPCINKKAFKKEVDMSKIHITT